MQKSIDESKTLPPGPRRSKFFNFVRQVSDFARFRESLRRKYGDIFYYETLGPNFCVVYDLDLMHEIFMATVPDPNDPEAPPIKVFTKLQGSETECPYTDNQQSGMNPSDDQEHERAVKLMALPFRDERCIEAHSVRIIENAHALLERWTPGRTIKLRRELYEYMANCVTRINLGSEIDAIRPRAVLEAMTGYKLDTAMREVPGTALPRKLMARWFRHSLEELDALIYRIIKSVRQGSHDPYCTVSYLIKTNMEEREEALLSDKMVRDMLFNELTIGIDPPTYVFMRLFGHIAYYSEVRERLEEEVDDAIGDRRIQVEDYEHLPYTRAILQETLRLGLPTPTLPRMAREDCVPGGYLIPKGTLLTPVLGALHRDPQYWDRPEEFRPDRWLEDPQPDRSRYAYMPFGYADSDRQCVAEEIANRAGVYLLASAVQRLRLDLTKPGPLKDKTTAVMISTVKGSVPMKVSERPHRV